MNKRMPKSEKAVSWTVRKARREGEALAFMVEALEICEDWADQARVISHACRILGITVKILQDARMSDD